jgi:hypothetical protein
MRLSRVGWLVALGALFCAVTVPALSAQAFTVGNPPGAECAGDRISNEVVVKRTALLSPSNGATVPAGAAVTFSGESGFESPLTFRVASSPAMLSTPDIDSGPGSLLPGTSSYTFTSSKATATPGTIYSPVRLED